MEQAIDYAEAGLMAGLEVHQQLLTHRKMFCKCPAGLYTRDHDGSILRHMRPTLSELGEYDGTALMEFKTKKNIIYLLHKANVCTYEMDDTPPFLLNQEALDVAVEQCLMLGCDIVDEVHVARKQYLDGSIPTGFQRTAIVGVNGRLPFQGRQLSITQVSVEEDSCREVSDRGHLIVWRTDRLGMPLIETVTGPDLRTPDEVAEAILLVGRVCRTTRHVRVGIGASRQDVNVSVRGGRRVEIKGVPKADWARRLVHGEAIRQVNLLGLRAELHRRGFKAPADLKIEHGEITPLLSGSQYPFFHSDTWETFVKEQSRRPGFELGEGGFAVRAVKLPGLAGTLGWPTQPDHFFSHELAGRVRVIAGLDQQPILVQSDRWPDYAESQRELRKIRQKLRCGPEDAVVIVWGPAADTVTAALEIGLRYEAALDGVPNETRQPFPDGSTDFERILPGPDRMYPDTDHPPVRMTRERVERLRVSLPPPPWVREAIWEGAGVPRQTVRFLIRRGGADLVDLVIRRVQAEPRRACLFFGELLKGLQRAGLDVRRVDAERWVELFAAARERPVLWEASREIAASLARDPGATVPSVLKELGMDQPPGEWEGLLDETLVGPAPDFPDGTADQVLRFHMGRVMPRLRGRIPGRRVSELLLRRLGAPGAAVRS